MTAAYTSPVCVFMLRNQSLVWFSLLVILFIILDNSTAAGSTLILDATQFEHEVIQRVT